MIALLRREFTVDQPIEAAWRRLAQVEQWPTWAKHIRKITVEPQGAVGGESTGVLRLTNGIKSSFRMTEFNPHRNWKWTGKFLWLTIDYDHLFESVGAGQTKLTWIVEGKGFGVAIFGRLFAKIYCRNLDQAIPALQQQMRS